MKINLVNTTDKPEISNLFYFTLWMHISTIREHFPFLIQKKKKKKLPHQSFRYAFGQETVYLYST